jgi:dynactin-6
MISKSAVICGSSSLISENNNEITIGDFTVINPKARLRANKGPIIIGQNNIIEENVEIINDYGGPLIIGNNNIFRVSCVFRGKSAGDNNIFECRSEVYPLTTIGDNCVLGVKCRTGISEIVQSNTVIYGNNNEHRVVAFNFNDSQKKHVDYLCAIIPKYNHVLQS